VEADCLTHLHSFGIGPINGTAAAICGALDATESFVTERSEKVTSLVI
jgi:hypothetical protein